MTRDVIPVDASASSDLKLLKPFDGDEQFTARQGDVLYLPPRVAHWGIAERACVTCSIGMRAPPHYTDPDLEPEEVRPGYISPAAIRRFKGKGPDLGRTLTGLKAWLQPEIPSDNDIDALLANRTTLRKLRLHGMARLAFDDARIYLNGHERKLAGSQQAAIAQLCKTRRMNNELTVALSSQCLRWRCFRDAGNAARYVNCRRCARDSRIR
jgi:ribosomal protein L16 Arg81 hydroxylase